MATIQYKCDTCERNISLTENVLGLTVFAKCIITEGCKGKLYKLSRSENVLRQTGDFPTPVAGLNDYVKRRGFFEKTINISSNPWKIEHNLGVSPAVTVYFFNEENNEPFEVSPDEYTVTIVDKDNIEITFPDQSKGIVHLISRSSVPLEVTTVSATDDLFQVSHEGHITLSVPSIITESGTVIFLTEDDFDLEIEIQIPSNPILTIEETLLLDILPATSPWLGWNQILIRKRRNFTTKDLNILSAITAAYPSITTLEEIPDGTSFSIKKIRYRNVSDAFVGDLIDIEPRQLFLLYASSPFNGTDKVRNKMVDVGELLVSSVGRFFIFDGEVFLSESNIEKIYPRIEQGIPSSLVVTPTPLPTISLTPSVTPPVTPTLTPPVTVTISITPSITPTIGVSPTPPETPPVTPPETPGVTPTSTVTPTPTITVIPPTPTPTASPSGFVNLTNAEGSDFNILGNLPIASVSINFAKAGGLSIKGSSIPDQWFNGPRPSNTGEAYEVRATIISGNDSDQDSGTNNTWLKIDVNRSWVWKRPILGLYTAVYRFEIRDRATLTIQDTMDLTVTLTVVL